MKTKKTWAVIALMMAAITACSSSHETTADTPLETPETPLANEDNERKDIELTRSQTELVNNSNGFAFNLFRALHDDMGQTEKSYIISPISITYALGMLNNGAAGETQQQINTVLGFGNNGVDSINNFCHKMLTEAPNLDKLTKVMIANTIYMNKNYKLKSSFVQTANTYYNAQPETRDFHDGQTLNVINQWGSDHTEKMIEKVLNEQSFNPNAVSYLLNAIYFKGVWAKKFEKSNTQNEVFEGADQQVPMMHMEQKLNYTETESCQAIRLPYGNHAYSMTILLPKEGASLSAIVNSLTAETWKQYQYMGTEQVDLKLPRFESNTDVELNKIMSKLGMSKAFTDFAEFPYFCNVDTKIDLMKQVARIKLDEEGTEAAAVTVIGMVEATAIPSEPRRVVFHANHPFLYVISEQSTGAIFFIGQYTGH